MGSDPSDVLSYLQKRWPDLSLGLRSDNLDDLGVLLVWDWWVHSRRERWGFHQVVKLGGDRVSFAGHFGVRSRQGFKDRLDRLDELHKETGSRRPDEQAARADRRAAAAAPVGDEQWLASAREDILQLGRDALEYWLDVDEETANSLVEVRRDVQGGGCTIETLGWLHDAIWDMTVSAVEKVAAAAEQLLERLEALEAGRKQAQAAVGSPA